MKSLQSLGEFGLIELFRKRPIKKHPAVLLGIGDDAAVLKGDKEGDLLFTTDLLIEGKHFHLGEATPFEIGRKAIAVNLSDIAAMGGRPLCAVAAVGLPAALKLPFVLELYRGIERTAQKFGACLVGGDTNQSDRLVISVAMLGRTFGRGKAVRRSGAKKGDVLFVTGELGGSYRSKKHLCFIPRLKEAEYLVKHFRVSAMMDLSDGLGSDLWRLTGESRVGAFISKEAVPVSRHARSFSGALRDGEDFELLFSLPPQEAARLAAAKIPKEMAVFRPIGKIVDKRFGVKLVRVEGRWEILPETGFDHFKRK